MTTALVLVPWNEIAGKLQPAIIDVGGVPYLNLAKVHEVLAEYAALEAIPAPPMHQLHAISPAMLQAMQPFDNMTQAEPEPETAASAPDPTECASCGHEPHLGTCGVPTGRSMSSCTCLGEGIEDMSQYPVVADSAFKTGRLMRNAPPVG